MDTTTTTPNLQVSEMADNLVGSEIIGLAFEVKEKIAQGNKIYNLTIGDFNPEIFPIPEDLTNEIIAAYKDKQTNYPAAPGTPELREAVSKFIKRKGGFDYRAADEIVISGGARPLLYSAYMALVDAGDNVVFPAPSWNNNHYTHLTRSNPIYVETTSATDFMPTAEDFRPHIQEANLIALCSPLNPTGTVFQKGDLEAICDLILEENNRRGADKKPVYLIYDQIYWMLTHGDTKHHDPVALRPEMKNYTVFIDGLSKCFAGTGVRVGWGYGPKHIIAKMRAICSHMGAWAPKAEQVATGKFLEKDTVVDAFLDDIKGKINNRLQAFYNGLQELKSEGHNVDAIAPQAAMYLTIKLDLVGKTKPNGEVIENIKQLTNFMIDDAGLALVPFSYFGASKDSVWYRLSVGTTSMEDVEQIITNLRNALQSLS